MSGRLWKAIISQKKHVQNLSVLVCVNLLVAGLGFITKVKIANILGKAEFGLFAYGIAVASYGATIISFGLNRTLVRDLIHFPKRQGQLVVSSLLLRGFMFFVVALTLLIWKFFSPAISDLTWGVVLIIFGQSMLGLELKAVYDSWGKMSRHAVYNFIQRCVYFAAVWLMIILSPKSLSVFWLGIFTIATVTFYMILQCKWAFNRIDFGGISRSILSATLALAKGNLIMWFSMLGSLSFGIINQIILKFYEGKESLGGYAAAWQIITIATLFLIQVARIGNPATARITKPGIEKTIRIKFLIKYSTVMFLVVFPVCLVTIVFPEMILRLIYKPEYASSAGALRIMGIYMMIYSLGFVAFQYIVSARMDKIYFASAIVGGCLSVVLCFVLIPRFSSLGAALSLLISHGTAMGLYMLAVVNHIRKSSQ
ncbi:MAG: oligosaccharide flippase family protein [Planctomycetota bacterium]